MSTFTDSLGLNLDEVTGQRVTGTLELSAAHHQPWGVVHGGVWTAVIETVATVGAVEAAKAFGMRAVGVHNSCDFVRPFVSGRAQVVATAVQQGRTQQLWDVAITAHEGGKLLATGRVRLANIT
jgi:1,4-dihydroxy-2-naphthoyl-CoA hydrolase